MMFYPLEVPNFIIATPPVVNYEKIIHRRILDCDFCKPVIILKSGKIVRLSKKAWRKKVKQWILEDGY